jgi:imidazolonepropionase-like amidohydrolase
VKSSLLAALLLTATGVNRAVAQDGSARSLAFTDVHIVDVEAGEVLPRQTVVIRGNRIESVGDVEDVPLPPKAMVIDGAGRYLIPALWDMHTHNFDLTGGYELEHQFALLVANGVLGVRDVGASGLTLREVDRIREEISSGERLGPRIIAAGPLVDGPERRHVFSVVPRDPDHARIVVDSLADAGADFIKIYANLRPDVYRALTDQANRRGIPFAGHLPVRIPLREAVDRGQRSFEHLHAVRWACSDAGELLPQAFNRWDRAMAAGEDTIPASAALDEISDRLKTTYDDGACRSQLAYMAHGGVALVPTMVEYRKEMVPPYELERDARLRYILPATRDWWDEELWGGSPPTREEWEAVREEWEATRRMNERVRGLIPLIAESGVLLLAGTDINNEFTFPGFSLHDELEAFVDAGLSPAEALRTATLNPAAFLEAMDSLGSVAPGKLADLVLLEADPLREIANTRRIAAVIANGQYLNREELDRMLQRVARGVAAARDAR